MTSEQEYILKDLREKIKPYLTDKRYRHTLEVEKEISALGEIYLPKKIFELRTAALLHDITKKYTLEKQLKCCEKFGIIVSEQDVLSPKVFHAKTAAEIAEEDFGNEIVSGEVKSGIRWHTTGHYGMTVFETLVYLADYIEASRDFEDCIVLRRYFYSRDKKADIHIHLRNTMIMSFDMTIKNLLGEKSIIDRDTVAARNYFIMQAESAGI